jgi:hypothetical protein
MPSPHRLLGSPAVVGSPAQAGGGGAGWMRGGVSSRTSSSSSLRAHGGDTFVRTQMDDGMHATALLAIETVSQLLSWVPLADVAAPVLLDCIFRFAALSDPGTVELGTAAMGCVNEVLARAYLPADLHEFLVHIYRYAASGTRGFVCLYLLLSLSLSVVGWAAVGH